ncbi:hypothetical protein JHK82_039177 [Glycine max]|nr:probable calcium-binding protein CML27 [Glycine max]XP_028201101.1 probable calcium-binding protein CML27 [Glycine soja]KAG4962488.1 hypothetical protein JHK86_039356 [Glycine max]KAG4964961.1 hypothetical protein JHK85_039936 [Glycine max]KAG5109954.1 hypothetical protein JHK82_039177 [Glycine max]|eukprot:XP_003545326.2 probable calcium-binding protein CML27 [Glycine max]
MASAVPIEPLDGKKKLAHQNMNELETIFNRFDTNGNGKISADELDSVLRSLGSDVSPEDLRHVMEDLDTDRDDFINLMEFVAFCRSDASIDGGSSEFRDAFDLYNRDKNGLISTAELHLALNSLDLNCFVDECRVTNRCVNFEEFKTMMTTSKNRGDATNDSVH